MGNLLVGDEVEEVKVSIVATLTKESAMMVFAIRMDATSTLIGWVTKNFMAGAKSLL